MKILTIKTGLLLAYLVSSNTSIACDGAYYEEGCDYSTSYSDSASETVEEAWGMMTEDDDSVFIQQTNEDFGEDDDYLDEDAIDCSGDGACTKAY